MPTIAPVVAALFQCVALSILLLLQSNPATAQSEEAQRAARYCAHYENSVELSDDGAILCFDGPIGAELPMERIEKLHDHGIFVIRSPGGYAPQAMQMAEALLEKGATVVIHDYCLSACANYILVATGKTYVLKSSVVAWHGGLKGANCDRFLREEDQSLFHFYIESHCKDITLQTLFFQKRGIQNRYIFSPQTTYTRMMVNTAAKTRGRRSDIFWMWNPQNYGDHFKDRVVYEQYPVSQFEVDRIMNRFHLGTPGQVIYDPDL